MKRAVVENLCISLALLGLCIFFELRHNREALLMALAALLALWKHSGRPRKDDAQPPRSAPAGGGLFPASQVPLWLVALLPLGLACHGGELTVYGQQGPRAAPRQEAARQAAQGVPTSATQINFDTSPVPLTCPSGKGCAAVNLATGRLYYHGTDGVNIEIGALAPGAAVPASQLTGQVPAANLTTALGAPPAIGGTTAAAGTFTTVTAQGQFTGPGTGLTGVPASQLMGLVAQTRGGLGADVSSSPAHCLVAGPTSGSGPVTCRAALAADLPQTIAAGSCTSCSLSWNGAGQLLTATSGAGGGGGAYFDPVVLYTVGADYLGIYTTGGRFVVVKAGGVVVTGIRFHRFDTPATITVKLWRGGSALASGSVAVSSLPGTFDVLFATPVSLSAGDVFYCTMYDGDGAPQRYSRGTALSWEPGAWTDFFAPHADGVMISHPGQYASGDAQPTTGSGSERFPVRPILQ